LTEVGRLESTNLNNYVFTPEVINKIASTSNRNLRLALIQLQASRYTKSTEGMLAPYKKEIKVISEMIDKEQSPNMLKFIRDKFYDLLVNCIDGQTIIK
jgi:replication factor C subunit 3/5